MKPSLIQPLSKRFYGIGFLLILTMLVNLATACGAAAPAREAAMAPMPPSKSADESNVAGAPAESTDSGSFERIAPIEQVLGSVAQAAERTQVIIYTGNLTLVVQDTRQSLKSIGDLTVAQGGYVASSNMYQAGDVPRGTITIRVPAESYMDTLDKLRALALRVESENSGTQDVSQEYTDLQARKTNLQFTEQALQKLLEERQRVGSTSDILEVYRELTDVRGQIEQIEGRLRFLANQSALSTITIELVPDVLSQPVSVAGWEPQGVAKQALQALVSALQVLANLLIWLVVFFVPLLIVFLIPVGLVIWMIRLGWRRYRTRKGATSPPKTPPAKTE